MKIPTSDDHAGPNSHEFGYNDGHGYRDRNNCADRRRKAACSPRGGRPDAAKIRAVGSIDAYRGLVMFLMMAEVLELRRRSRRMFPEQRVLVVSGLPPVARGMDRLLVARSDPAVVLVSWSAWHCRFRSPAERAKGQPGMAKHAARLLAGGRAGVAWSFPAIHPQSSSNILDVRRHAQPDRTWIRFPLHPGEPVENRPMVGSGGDSRRLLGGVRTLSVAGQRISIGSRPASIRSMHQTHLSGFAEHWSKNTNAAAAFDIWFLQSLSREASAVNSTARSGDAEFTDNSGGYLTLSFIPTLGTMILGLLAGGVLASGRANLRRRFAGSLRRGRSVWRPVGSRSAGICPVVKRIWTPSWVLFSGGWCFLHARRLLCGDGHLAPAPLGISARGHWHELDRGLYDRSSFSGIHQRPLCLGTSGRACLRHLARLTSTFCSALGMLVVEWSSCFGCIVRRSSCGFRSDRRPAYPAYHDGCVFALRFSLRRCPSFGYGPRIADPCAHLGRAAAGAEEGLRQLSRQRDRRLSREEAGVDGEIGRARFARARAR